MAYGQSSGTTAYQPLYSDLVLDAYERCGVYDLRSIHTHSARRSLNLRLQHWANRGINLWKVSGTPVIIDLVPGVQSYALPANTVSMLDTYRRTNTNSVVVGSAGTSGSIIPYLVGTPVPQSAIISTTLGSLYFNVAWTAHGRTVGDQVSLLWPVYVGGMTLGGVYNVVATPDANNITLIGVTIATSNSAVSVTDTSGQDVMMTPISRNDWAAISNKGMQGAPSVYWFDRQIMPQVNVWPIPDTNTAYQLQAFYVTQIEDAEVTGGDTPNTPQRFWMALVTDVAADLAWKWAPERQAALQAGADRTWKEAAQSDVEAVSTYIRPMFPSGL